MKLLHNGRLFTASEARTVERGWILLDDGRIDSLGSGPPPTPGNLEFEEDLHGALVTPGLIDAHTHPVYWEPRLAEVAQRSAGASYEEIAATGGGIGATVDSTRRASQPELAGEVRERLRKWLRGGCTTVEAKTGYHLNRDGELGAVELLATLAQEPDLPRLAITFLGAHAQPPDRPGSRAEYAAEVASWSEAAQRAGAEFSDVWCDAGYFTVPESRLVLEAGAAAGLKPRIHADELARSGGSLLAAELGAVSADHLLQITLEDAAALAASGVVATLAPATALSLGLTPPVHDLLAAGCTIALGSDHNPGTSGITSMSLIVSLGVAAFGLSVDEALVAATAGSAASIGRTDRGRLAAGLVSDLVVWDADHEGAFGWAYGPQPSQVWLRGARQL